MRKCSGHALVTFFQTPATMQIRLAPQMDLWDSLANCPFWDCWWMYLFARLAKHDSQGEMLPLSATVCHCFRRMRRASSARHGAALQP